MDERRIEERISVDLTARQWALIAEALGQMVKTHAAKLDQLVRAGEPLTGDHVAAFDSLSRTYADLVRELAESGLADPSARDTAQSVEEASALLGGRLAGGDKH